ncbi:electron transfer flavoprotein subunit alpha/FixB family protein [Bacillus sp. EB600]|uniref:electron transfer flavoprotein subunit alpha/FixB family protein n=1 Tax=Bacillus sp. EB600 TaxID=2806345 RepID=UPI00210E64C8|nr:electron transfer flavoprotein subunit alpha/FixB family protein [Bacillus sp. EB600]MCQ6279593.1 electron transfer flavoprotein subunit alpha/FixB family protein [Bacillus sp. EB600]
MSKNVLVFAESREGNIRNVSIEALAAAKQVSNGGKVIAIVFGSDSQTYVNQLAHQGANEVYVVQNSQLDSYSTDAYSQAFTQIIKEIQPDAIILGHTAIGKDLAPRIAARLDLGLISDCTGLEINDSEIQFIRPIYAGKAFQKKKVSEGTIFATIRPNNIVPNEANTSLTANVVHFDVEITNIRTVIKDVLRRATKGVDLTEAKIVVSGGRGVKNKEGFEPLYELANVLGAAVGASRGACDAKYCDYSMQVGQTGKVVTPDLYIACGISGAIQHVAGMSNSKIIVAINKDPEAPIFQVADYGIVGDLFEVVPMLTEEFKNLLAEVQVG